MIQLDDIYSLTDFQRNVKAHLQALKKTGRPRVLTVNGKAELIVQDAKSYQKLLELIDRVEAIEGIRQGCEDVAKGRVHPARDALKAFRRDYGISR
jgi:PHD/YefM family antitoxin component YafN of YafNO toxin-antitoxin module